MAHNALADNISAMASKLIDAQNMIDEIIGLNLTEWQKKQVIRIDDSLGDTIQTLAHILGNVIIYDKA